MTPAMTDDRLPPPPPLLHVTTLEPLDSASYATTWRGVTEQGARRIFVKAATLDEIACEVAAVRAARHFGLARQVIAVRGATLPPPHGTTVMVAPWVEMTPLCAAHDATCAIRERLGAAMRWRLLLWSFVIGDGDRRPENYGLARSGEVLAFDANFAFNARVRWYDTGKCAIAELSAGHEGLRDGDVIPLSVLREATLAGLRLECEASGSGEDGGSIHNMAALHARVRVLCQLLGRAEQQPQRTQRRPIRQHGTGVVTIGDLRAMCAEGESETNETRA